MAVTLIQDYVFTIVVSALSGVDQLLSVLDAYGINWFWHFAHRRGAGCGHLVSDHSRARRIVARRLYLAGHLRHADRRHGDRAWSSRNAQRRAGRAHREARPGRYRSGKRCMHMLTASMKGMVALTGLEAMSNGIQFVINEDAGLVKWGKKHLPRLKGLWNFYSGKAGIGRLVQTSFLFYGGLTTLLLTFFAIRFDVFDGTLGRTLVGNLAFIGFSQIPGRRDLVLGLPDPGGGLAGGGLDDGLPGCAGHRVARCGHRRDSRDHRLSRSARHLHPLGHHHVWHRAL